VSEAAIGVAIRSCPGVQPRRSYSRLHAIIMYFASVAIALTDSQITLRLTTEAILSATMGRVVRLLLCFLR
jgi:hypothetical protein